MERVPADLRVALNSRAQVLTAWKNLTPIARRDFLTWVTSAKQAETRKRRIERTKEMLLSGKRRPCCYAVVPMNLYKALGEVPRAKAAWKVLTPTERRDYVAWIEGADDATSRRSRVEKAVVFLLKGKKHP